MQENKNKKMKKGFSLMELMVVIVILGLLMAVVLPNLTGKSEEAKRKLSCVQMKNLVNSLKMFKVDNGRYPSTAEGLTALTANPAPDSLLSYSTAGYLEDSKIPLDPWNNPYIYIYGQANGLDIVSFASDGAEGGTGENSDIKYSECR